MQETTSGRSRWLGVALVALGALGFSSGIIFNRAITGLSGPEIAFFRALSGFAFFSALLTRYPEALHPRRYRATVPLLIGLGLAVGATATLYMTALRHTTAATAVLLNNTSAVYVALLAPWLLHESRPRFTWVSLALALTGMALIADPARLDLTLRGAGWIGLATSVGCGITYAFTMLFSRMVGGRVGGVTQSWWSVGIAALVALPFTFDAPLSAVRANWPYLLALGTLALGIPYFLFFQGLKRIRAQTVSIVALLEPVTGVLIGTLLYREIPSVAGWIGIALILASIVLISRK